MLTKFFRLFLTIERERLDSTLSIFVFSARGCGRQHKAWGEALAEPQEYGVNAHQAREAGGSFLLFALSLSLS